MEVTPVPDHLYNAGLVTHLRYPRTVLPLKRAKPHHHSPAAGRLTIPASRRISGTPGADTARREPEPVLVTGSAFGIRLQRVGQRADR